VNGNPDPVERQDRHARVFDAACEVRWLHELIASPLWGELNELQRKRWLQQLELLTTLQHRN